MVINVGTGVGIEIVLTNLVGTDVGTSYDGTTTKVVDFNKTTV